MARISSFLLANGVIVPPCKVGDNVYAITPFGIETFVVDLIKIIGNQQIRIRVRRFVKEIVYYSPESFGKTVFLTRAEAEKALKERGEVCKNCKHLMFSDCYGECRKAYKGIVNPDDTCEHFERRTKQ